MMRRLGRTVKDALVHRMQQPGTSGAFAVVGRVVSRAVARAQGASQRTPVLAKLAGLLAPLVLAKERAGSGKSVVLGAGRRGPLGIVYPGADSSAIPGAPGQILYGEDPVVINAGRDVVTVRVTNTADRPISVGSHYHFAEANPGLSFDREAAWGRRQNIVAGGMTRFDPGTAVDVELVPFAGRRNIVGFRGEGGGRFHA